MAKESQLVPDKKWTKAAASREILECQKALLELQKEYFGVLGTLEEGEYKRASETIKNMISDIKNHALVLQALLLEFDGGIPVAEEGVAKALRDLRDAMKDINE
jgi:hypothetical protein